MLAKVLTGAVVGLEGHPPEADCPERGRRVEVDIAPGLVTYSPLVTAPVTEGTTHAQRSREA